MVQFTSYLRRALCKTRLIFPRINGPIICFHHLKKWRKKSLIFLYSSTASTFVGSTYIYHDYNNFGKFNKKYFLWYTVHSKELEIHVVVVERKVFYFT